MNANSVARTITACFILASAVVSHPVYSASRCEQPVAGGDARACAASREGPVALRRFIWRTRAIYRLSYQEFAPPETDTRVPATAVPKVAVSRNEGESSPAGR